MKIIKTHHPSCVPQKFITSPIFFFATNKNTQFFLESWYKSWTDELNQPPKNSLNNQSIIFLGLGSNPKFWGNMNLMKIIHRQIKINRNSITMIEYQTGYLIFIFNILICFKYMINVAICIVSPNYCWWFSLLNMCFHINILSILSKHCILGFRLQRIKDNLNFLW